MSDKSDKSDRSDLSDQLWHRFGLAVAVTIILLLSALLPAYAGTGEEISVAAAVDSQQVYVGSPFLLQIQVNGASSPGQPDLSGLTDFQVQQLGGQQNNNESITIVNGRMERVSRHGYIFNYHLTAKQAGSLVIPSLTVIIDGKNYQTRAIPITATRPAASGDFKLRLSLSKTECYVGEPLVLTVTWLLGKGVEDFSFDLPVLEDARFSVVFIEDPGLTQQNAVKIAVGRQAVIARKGSETVSGREFLTVSFKYFLIPQQAGTLTLPQATVTCKTVAGNRPRGMADPFADFFDRDLFGRGRQAVYQTVTAQSNEPGLTIRPLPEAGRPANFSGLVGQYSIAAQASPVDVKVGDPITLSIMVTGPEFLDNVTLPPLQEQQPLATDFKIPEEMGAGELKGGVKSFVQTIRANHAGVKEVPPIALSFFNPATGKYETARTAAIPLTVQATRMITAQDAEGRPVVAAKQEIKAVDQGIAHNYEDSGVLENQDRISLWIQSARGMMFIAGLPLLYLLFWGSAVLARRQRQDPEGQRARRAYAELAKELAAIAGKSQAAGRDPAVRLGEAMQAYLAKKLRLAAQGAITYGDVRERLTAAGVGEETLSHLRQLLEQCEAHRFGGVVLQQVEFPQLLAQAREVVRDLERSLQ